MSKLQTLFHQLYKVFPLLRKPLYVLFMKIAPPRIRRLCYFVIYVGLTMSGSTLYLKSSPTMTQNAIGGQYLIYVFATFIVLGSLVCAVAVLPGIWWFERAGLYLIASGIIMYAAMLVFLGASPFVTVLPIVFVFILAIRWLDIREFLLAPKGG